MLSSYYILVLDDHIEHHLPNDVIVENNTVIFNNSDPIECEVQYHLSHLKHLTMSFVFNTFVQVNLIEKHYCLNDTQINKKYVVKEQAQVHLFHQNSNDATSNLQLEEVVDIEKNALCQTGFAEFSSENIKANYKYYLNGENAQAYIRMAILANLTAEKKYQVIIEHNAPHTYGQMDNYGVAKDQSRLTIDGIGTIKKGQYGSASHQTNKIMVFDKDVIASANPYLYIDEYDVKASHAAAVGKMDEEHLYYLQSRGLTKKQAMQLITYGYLHPVVDVIQNQELKQQFEEVLSKVGE